MAECALVSMGIPRMTRMTRMTKMTKMTRATGNASTTNLIFFFSFYVIPGSARLGD